MERLAHRPPRKLVKTADARAFQPEINKKSKQLSNTCTWWDRLSSPAWEQAEELRNHYKKTIGENEEEDDETFVFLYEETTKGSLPLDLPMLELDYSNFELDILEQRQSTSREEKYFDDLLEIADEITATKQVHTLLHIRVV